jgi:hypothetical protein
MSNDSLPSFNRHLRLALLCTTSVAICSAFLLATLILNIRLGFSSTPSWTVKAWDFAHIETITAENLDKVPSKKVIYALDMILPPVLGLHFFVFFGFLEEAMRRIRSHHTRLSTNSVLPEAWRRRHRFTNHTSTHQHHEAGPIEITPPSPAENHFAVMPVALAPTYSSTNHNTTTTTPTHSPPPSRPPSVLTHHGSVEPQSPLTPSLTNFPIPPPHFFHELSLPPLLQTPEPTWNGQLLDHSNIRQVSVHNVRDSIVSEEDNINRNSLRPFYLDASGTHETTHRDAGGLPQNGRVPNCRRNGWPRYV